MSGVIAIDVAILPPADIMHAARDINRALRKNGSQGLLLDDDHLPHITLTQQFVDAAAMERVLARVDAVARQCAPLPLRVIGAGGNDHTVWMAVEKTRALADLHRALMKSLHALEMQSGDRSAFVDADARPGDLAWVSSFREKASVAAYTPHITLGHSTSMPEIAVRDFLATRLAVCQLGRFCTCRRVLREWTLS